MQTRRKHGPGHPPRPLSEDLREVGADLGRALAVTGAGVVTLFLASIVLVPTTGATRSAKLTVEARRDAIARAMVEQAEAGRPPQGR